MNINIDDDDDRMFRIGASNDSDSQQQLKSKTSMPTIYPNDYDFNVATGFGAKSTTSRSFIRPTKNLSQEHRNISVPNSLKVQLFLLLFFIFLIAQIFVYVYAINMQWLSVCPTNNQNISCTLIVNRWSKSSRLRECFMPLIYWFIMIWGAFISYKIIVCSSVHYLRLVFITMERLGLIWIRR